MTLALLATLLLLATAGQSGDQCPDCTDSTRPWMRGQKEIACAIDGKPVRGDQAAEWRVCSCRHECDPTDERADETGARKWDPKCEARCRPYHCHCPHPCGEGA